MPDKKKPILIRKKHLILCEGMDAWKFLVRYLNSSALQKNPFFSEDIDVLDFRGKEALSAYLEALKKIEGYSDVVWRSSGIGCW